MIQDIKDAIGKISKDRIVIGLDLSDEFSQISYAYMNGEEPQTLSTVVGGDDICIPTKLAKERGQSNWTYGFEAEEMHQNGKGAIIDNLLSRARSGGLVMVEGREYDPTDLLALYMKRCFSLLALVAPIEKVSVIMITVDHPDSETIRILKRAVTTLRIKPEKVFYQSYSESAYHYMLHQKRELWTHDVIFCHLRNEGLYIRTMKKNSNTNPMVVMIEENDFKNISNTEIAKSDDIAVKHLDQSFMNILMGFCEDRQVSSIYLLGAGFENEWFPEALKYMCRNRRIFGGNNLFSKGACYGAREKLEVSDIASRHVFLGKDKVKANVGMRCNDKGEETYIALLDAGKNWYETSRECELILDREDTLNFVITPLSGTNVRNALMYLTGIPVREAKATRVHIELKMLSERKMMVTVTDMGFGEFYPPSGMVWSQEIVLD